MNEARTGFNRVFSVLDSIAYRNAVDDATKEDPVPSWVLPYSFVTGSDLVRIASELRLGPGSPFVDLGCGLGGPGMWVAEETGASLTGVDFADEAIARARDRAQVRGIEARFVAADMVETGLPSGSFAGVMSVDAIPFADPAAVTAEIARLLEPAGIVALTAFEPDEPQRPTAVRDYRPYFERAGLKTLVHEETPRWRRNMLAFYAALLKQASRLRDELGDAAQGMLDEAERAPLPRRLLIVASKN